MNDNNQIITADTLIDTNSITTENTEAAFCPHCGFELEDTFFHKSGSKISCNCCQKQFMYFKQVKITYSTFKIE